MLGSACTQLYHYSGLLASCWLALVLLCNKNKMNIHHFLKSADCSASAQEEKKHVFVFLFGDN